MTDVVAVKEQLKLLGGYQAEEICHYSPLVENCISVVFNLLKSPDFENDFRVINLCAAKALYAIESSLNTQDDVTSFKAGDISMQIAGKSIESARQILNDAKNDCRDILLERSFAFVSV